MPRLQLFKAYPQVSAALALTPYQLTAVSQLVTSITIEANPNNTDFILIGDATNQVRYIAPGKSLEIEGDKLDNGTQAFFDISTIYFQALVAGESVNYIILDGN